MNDPRAGTADLLIEELTAAGVRLQGFTITDNRVSLVSVRRVGSDVILRVAASLLGLGPRIVDPVVGFVAGRPGAKERLKRLVEGIPEEARPPSRRRTVVRPRGRFHDLGTVAEPELARFEERPNVHVTWGRRQRIRRGQRSLRFGSYDGERRIVRIHPILDQPGVPAWFIGFVIYHELLHHALGCESANGRRRVHTPEFRRRERTHPHYDDAMAWEKANIARLLRGPIVP